MKTIEEALDALRRGELDTWNIFRSTLSSDVNLSAQKFFTLRLREVNFSSCNLAGCEFFDCDLSNSDFAESELRDASFIRCDLSEVYFENCEFMGVNFRGCSFDGAAFIRPSHLSADQFSESDSLHLAELPARLESDLRERGQINSWDEGEDPEGVEDLEDEEVVTSIKIDEEEHRVPVIPLHVPAPIEVQWIGDRLTLHHSDHASLLGFPLIARAISAYRKELEQFATEVKGTNIDQRIITRIEQAAATFPTNVEEFSRCIFDIWYKMRPVFHYGKLTQAEHLDYMRAKFLALEGDLRDILSSFSDWREYEAAAQSMRLPQEFDMEVLKSAQRDFKSSLEKFPQYVDRSIIKSYEFMIEEQSAYSLGSPIIENKDEMHDAASSNANVLSRLLKRVIDEAVAGGVEGVRASTKSLVTAAMVGGGGTLIWVVAKGLGGFEWLWNAWQFVRLLLKI